MLTPFQHSCDFQRTSSFATPQNKFPSDREQLNRYSYGQINGQPSLIRSTFHKGTYFLEVERCGRFTAESARSEVIWLDSDLATDSNSLLLALLTPSFLLLGSRRGHWLLHSSAARFGDKLIAFVGKSGYGKSTLAAFLDQQASWSRVADDMLPISGTESAIEAWPRFPQFKIAPHAQPGLLHPERLKLDVIYLLETSTSTSEAVEIAPVQPVEAITTIAGQTAGARLFDPALLSNHLHFCSNLVESVPVRKLRYPRSFEMLPAVERALRCDLKDLG